VPQMPVELFRVSGQGKALEKLRADYGLMAFECLRYAPPQKKPFPAVQPSSKENRLPSEPKITAKATGLQKSGRVQSKFPLVKAICNSATP